MSCVLCESYDVQTGPGYVCALCAVAMANGNCHFLNKTGIFAKDFRKVPIY